MISNQELHDIFTGQKEVIDTHGAKYLDNLAQSAFFFKEDNPKRYTNSALALSVSKILFAYKEDTRIEESASALFFDDPLIKFSGIGYNCDNLQYVSLVGNYNLSSIGINSGASLTEIHAPNCIFDNVYTQLSQQIQIVEVGQVNALNFQATTNRSPVGKLISHGKVQVVGPNSFNYWRNGFTIWLLSESQDELLMPGSGQTACYTKPTATIKCKTQALCDYCASLWAELNPNFTFEVLTEEELHDYLG